MTSTIRNFENLSDLISDPKTMEEIAAQTDDRTLWAQVDVSHFFDDEQMGKYVEVFNQGVKIGNVSMQSMLDEEMNFRYWSVGPSFREVNRCMSKSGNRTVQIDPTSGRILGVYDNRYDSTTQQYVMTETYRARG